MSAAEFHTLEVDSVERLTAEAVAVEFAVPADLAERYRFTAGQHVVLRRQLNGHDVRRSYSICVPAGSGRLRVAMKRVPDGTFSTFATTALHPGMAIEVTTPIGDFTAVPRPEAGHKYCAIAAGSGITPIISIIATLLAGEPLAEVYLIFGNRSGASIMFLDELADLKDRFLDRLTLLHVLSREAAAFPILEGRLEAEKIDTLLDLLVPVKAIDRWFLCGPLGVVEAANAALTGRGVSEDKIGHELFFDERPPAAPQPVPGASSGSVVRFTMDGRTSHVQVDPSGPPILDYVLTVRADAPYSCRSGACASCRALVTSGEVRMHHNWALTEGEVAGGQVLSCQAHPVTDEVSITYDI